VSRKEIRFMSKKMVKGLMYKVGAPEPMVVSTDASLESLHKIVGGDIETVYIRIANHEKAAILVCNDEGKIKGLPYSCYVPKIKDMIAGDCIILGDGGEDFTDAPPEILKGAVWVALPVFERDAK
jgi:hypothetical protein